MATLLVSAANKLMLPNIMVKKARLKKISLPAELNETFNKLSSMNSF